MSTENAIHGALLLFYPDIAAKLGRSDVLDLSPTAIAIEVCLYLFQPHPVSNSFNFV